MDIIKEELDIFKASANRMRWYISTAVLISMLILLHVYLEQFSFQQSQLKGITGNRILKDIDAQELCYAAVIKATHTIKNTATLGTLPECSPPLLSAEQGQRITSLKYRKLVREYSAREFDIHLTNNTIKDIKMPTRQVPILGTDIPANDFVLVMAIISMFFVVGVWLNLRGLSASLTSLAAHDVQDLMRIAQLNTVFLTSIETGGSRFAQGIRAACLWLPFYSILLGTGIGYAPLLLEHLIGSDSYAGSNTVIVSFLGLSLIIIALHYWIASKCQTVMKEIDVIFKTHNPANRNPALGGSP